MSTLNRILGNARNNSIYGSAGEDSLDGGAGNDYLRGYGGNDVLTGGTGADRFVFERTLLANGVDTITDFLAADGDVLDFSLVGFARGVFSRYQLSDIIRVSYSDGAAQVQIDLDGGGDNFVTWANLQNVELGAAIRMSIGGVVLNTVVTDFPLQIQSFRVSGESQLSVTVDRAATAALVLPPAPVGPIVNPLPLGVAFSGPLTANTPGTITVAAQPTITETVLRATDGSNLAGPTPDTVVYLGTSGSDFISGTSAADIIFGFDSNDEIFGEDGADTIQGGNGNDTIYGGAGADDLSGGDGNDTFFFASNADLMAEASVSGGDGFDTLVFDGTAVTAQASDFTRVVGAEAVVFTGFGAHSITLGTATNTAFSAGILIGSNAAASLTVNGAASAVIVNAVGSDNADNLTGGTNNDVLTSGAGADVLVGNGGNDELYGESGADILTGGAGTDTMEGGDGSDVFIIAVAADHAATESINGGGGNSDVIRFTSTAGATLTLTSNVTVEIAAISDAAGSLVGTTNESINAASAIGNIDVYGNAGNNTLTGNIFNNRLIANEGNDTLTGNGGNDTMTGGSGNDRFNVDAAGTATITDLGGSDVLVVSTGATANAAVTAAFTAAVTTSNSGTANLTLSNGVNANLSLAAGTAGFTVTAAGNASGSSVTGSAQDDTLTGGLGDDILTGGAGADSLTGGSGNDTFVLAGNDTVVDFNSTQFDSVTTAGLVAGNSVTFTTVTGTLNLSGSLTTAAFTATAAATGATITGGAGNDSLTGGAVADSLVGGGGDDTLNGGGDADTLTGGASNDSLTGGAGADSMTGGANADAFVLEGNDTVVDFSSTESDTVTTTALVNGNAVTFTTVTGTLDLSGSLTTAAFTATAAATGATITGGAGNDSLTGGAVADSLVGGDGDDTLTGNAGNDSLTGGNGNDLLVFASTAELAADSVVGGGADVDTLRLNTAAAAVTLSDSQLLSVTGMENLDLAGTGTQVVTLGANVNAAFVDGITVTVSATATSLNLSGTAVGWTRAITATGTSNNDTLLGGSAADSLTGGGGNDSIDGGAGADTLHGGAGNDVLIGRAGDELYGDGDNDQFSFDVGGGVLLSSMVTIDGGAGSADEIFAWNGLPGNVTLADADFANVTDMEVLKLSAGGTGSVTLASNANAAFANGITVTNAITAGVLVVNGSAATVAITATGGTAADTITSGAGSDTLSGGDNDDQLTGGAGADSLTGGAGNDTFVFASGSSNAPTLAGADVISDFVTGADLIDVGGTIIGMTIADGLSLADYAAFIAAANDTSFSNGQLNVYVAYNAAGSGDAWAVIDQNASGAFNADTDSVIVLTGVNQAAEITFSDFNFIT